jgi:hypothetical protein
LAEPGGQPIRDQARGEIVSASNPGGDYAKRLVRKFLCCRMAGAEQNGHHDPVCNGIESHHNLLAKVDWFFDQLRPRDFRFFNRVKKYSTALDDFFERNARLGCR